MKYAILNTSNIGTVDFSKVKQTDANSVRKTLDGNKFMVKFEGDTPDFLNNKTQYTLLEMQTILNNVSNGWIDENED